MSKYIDADRLIAEIERYEDTAIDAYNPLGEEADYWHGKVVACEDLKNLITSLQQEQPDNMIQWTGNNLKEVIDFTGKSPRFEEWFKSWEEFETYVHQHNDILKLFCEDGNHYEVPVGAWIVKTPDGHNVPSVARFIQAKQEQPEDKQTIVITESRGDANIIWDCRSLSDVIALLKSAESFITEKQIEKIAGPGSGPDYATTEGRYSHLFKHQQEQPEVDLEKLGEEVENFCLEYDARKDAWYNMTPRDQKLLSNPTWLNFATNIASHFYELGLNARKEESVSVAESPSKTFPRVNEFDCGSSYRH